MERQRLRTSVVMTTFRAGDFLSRQLASMSAQTRPPDEIVVSDDASDDDTWVRLEAAEAASTIPMVLHRQQENVGLRRNIESALRLSSGDVIVLADQDDLWRVDKVETLATAFERDPTVTLWFSDAELIDSSDTELGRRAWQAVGFDGVQQESVRDGDVRRLLHGQTVTGATMAFRASALGLALPLPEELEGDGHLFLHDGWIAVVTALQGRVVVEPRALTLYRQHRDQVTGMSLLSGTIRSVPGSLDQLGIDAARTRLVANRVVGLHTAQATDVLRLDAFLKARSGPPMGVIRHLIAGSYGRYSGGARSAAKDLLRWVTL